MLQLKDIPIDENSQGETSLNLMSYLKKSQYQSQKMSQSQKKIVSKKVLGLVSKNLV